MFASSNLGRLTSEKKWQTVGWKYLSQCHIERERERKSEQGQTSPHCSRLHCTIPHIDRLPANCLLMGVSSRRSCNPKCSKQKLSVLGLALAIEIVSQSLHFTKVARHKRKKTKNHFIILEIELFFAFQQLLIIFFLLAAAAVAVADKGNSNSAKDECKANSSSNNNDNSIYLL